MRQRPPVVLVVRGIIRVGNRILLLQRSSKDFQPDQWELPGGKIDQNQLIEDAITREIFEETGLKVERRRLLYYLNDILEGQTKYPGHMYLVLFFECWPENDIGNINISHEHQGWMLANQTEALSLPLTKGTHEILEKFFSQN